jgi:hypothetical protein
MGNLLHSGYLSYCKYDDLKEWYTTITDNEIIEFKDLDGQQRHINSLLIEAESTDLYIRILPLDYILFIPKYETRSYDLESIMAIQIMNLSDVKLRWSGMFF